MLHYPSQSSGDWSSEDFFKVRVLTCLGIPPRSLVSYRHSKFSFTLAANRKCLQCSKIRPNAYRHLKVKRIFSSCSGLALRTIKFARSSGITILSNISFPAPLTDVLSAFISPVFSVLLQSGELSVAYGWPNRVPCSVAFWSPARTLFSPGIASNEYTRGFLLCIGSKKGDD